MERHISKEQVDKQSFKMTLVALAIIAAVIGYGLSVIHMTPLKNYFDKEHSFERALDNFGKPDRDLEDTLK